MSRLEIPAGSRLAIGLLAVLPLWGCGGSGGNPPAGGAGSVASQPLSEAAQELVNQGNAAQRAGRYDEALDYFTQALELHPDHPVPQFGTLLAASAAGDTVLARSMREKLATTGPELLEMLGPEGMMGGEPSGGAHMPPGSMPPGHPPVSPSPADTVSPRTGVSG